MQRHGFMILAWTFMLLTMVTYFVAIASADEFNAAELRDVWTWDDPDNDDAWSLVDNPGWFRFTVQHEEDTWDGNRGDMPLLLRTSPTGDYSMETHVKIDEQPNQTYGALIVWQGGGNWIHLELIREDGGQINGVLVQYWPAIAGGNTGQSAQVEADEVYLRIERQGNDWSLLYKSEEEDEWELLEVISAVFTDPHQVGIGAKTFSGDGSMQLVADFDYFRSEELGETSVVQPKSKLAVSWARIKVGLLIRGHFEKNRPVSQL